MKNQNKTSGHIVKQGAKQGNKFLVKFEFYLFKLAVNILKHCLRILIIKLNRCANFSNLFLE